MVYNKVMGWVFLLYGFMRYVTSDPPPPEWAIGLIFMGVGLRHFHYAKKEERDAARSNPVP